MLQVELDAVKHSVDELEECLLRQSPGALSCIPVNAQHPVLAHMYGPVTVSKCAEIFNASLEHDYSHVIRQVCTDLHTDTHA